MAKRQRNEVTTTHLVNVCAFIALGLSALLYVVGGVLNWLGFNQITSVLHAIASYALLIAIAIPAWRYVRPKRKIWHVLYILALLIYILGVMFGLIGFYIKIK